jgi:hypothetical protein
MNLNPSCACETQRSDRHGSSLPGIFQQSVRVNGAREADAGWLPLLKAWSAVETRRARESLRPIIARLEARVEDS